ncbi:MAG: helix-turn-helix domain-containing protein [Fusobacterium sp.]|nr:helix-turn-helix domain-containing protein [Fusobacterium sp.]
MSEDAYNTLLAKFGIVTDYMSAKQNIAQITKEKLQALVASGKSVKVICEELRIPERTYSRLLDKFGLITGRKASKQHVASITHEMLQGLVDAGFSKQEICERLKIQDYMFYRLLKRLHVEYNYLHNAGEIKISKARLEELVRSGKTAEEIAKELGVAVTTFHQKAKELGVATVFRESIDRINSISKVEIQKALDSGISINAICEKFGITEMNYIALLRKHNLSTSQRESGARISEITKEQILSLRKAGKNTQEICKELNISKSTLRRILAEGKNLEQA